MELWVRSQDKINLIKLNHIYVDVPLLNGSTAIIGRLSDETNRILGYYRTKERALEVLDEIQKLLMPVITYTQKEPIKSDLGQGIYQIKQDVDLKIQQLSTYVYEMPKE